MSEPEKWSFSSILLYFLDKWGPFSMSRYIPAPGQNHAVATWMAQGMCLVWYADMRVVSLRRKPEGETIEWADDWEKLYTWRLAG